MTRPRSSADASRDTREAAARSCKECHIFDTTRGSSSSEDVVTVRRSSRLTRTVRLAILVFATISLTFVVGRRTAGFSFFQSGGVAVVWPGAQSLRFLSPSTFPSGSTVETRMLEAMGLWNIVPASDFQYSFSRLTQDPVIDHFDGFNDTAAVPQAQLDPGVLGVTSLVNQGAQWFDMDVLFSDFPLGVGYNFDPNPTCDVVSTPTPTNGFSFELVAVHELGHALGLGHNPIGDEPPGTPWFVATMNPRYPSGGPIGQENIIELHTDDRNGVRSLYPHSGPAGPGVIDLASAAFTSSSTIGRAVPLAFTPPVALPGEDVSLRSFIENFGTTNEFSVRQGFYLSTDSFIGTADTFLGSLMWDLAKGDAFEFGVAVTLPADLPAGTYYLGSILDDVDLVPELFEDNNAGVYCDPLTVAQLTPSILSLGQQIIPCDQPFTGPSPGVSRPLNMAPITWSLDNPQPGMSIHPTTGVISWPAPISSTFLYTLFVRATNAAGSSTQVFFLGVNPAQPAIVPPTDSFAFCTPGFVSPALQLTLPRCMAMGVSWSIDAGPPGLTIDPTTGVVSWLAPVPSATPYPITIRATNPAGAATASFRLSVVGGDFDGNGTVGLTDLSSFAACLNGPVGGVVAGCSCGDEDADGDLDLHDFAALQNTFQP